MENTDSSGQSSNSKKGLSKIIVLSAIVIILLILGALGYMVMGNKSAKIQTREEVTQNAPIPTTSNAFTSIKDALSKSVSLQCNFTDDSSRNTTTYIKGGAIRSDYVGSNTEESGSVIMRDEKMYFWNGKEGMMMEFDISQMAVSVTPGAKSVPPSQQNPEDILEGLEKFKESCKPAVVADSLFTPPTDVKFTDMSEMMKAVQKTQPSVPTGVMTEEQMKELQKKFQQ